MAVHGEPGMEKELFEVIEEYRNVCRDIGQDMAHVALAWVRQQEGVTTVLVGARNAREVGMNLPSLELTLPVDVVEKLHNITERIKANLGSNPDMWHGENRMR